jgi:hypothetical protein
MTSYYGIIKNSVLNILFELTKNDKIFIINDIYQRFQKENPDYPEVTFEQISEIVEEEFQNTFCDSYCISIWGRGLKIYHPETVQIEEIYIHQNYADCAEIDNYVAAVKVEDDKVIEIIKLF